MNAFQKRVFAACSSSEASTSGVTAAWIVGVNRCSSPSASRELVGEWEPERVDERERVGPHDDEQLRLDDVELAREPRPGLVLVLHRELEAVRPVHRHRVDAKALERLEDRLAGAAVERHALLQLGSLRAVFQEEDVRERMAGADHGHALAARGAGDLVPELVDLGDRLLQVLLVDLVGGHGHEGGLARFAPSAPFPWPGRST